ncbi:MAG: hypothetical protein ACYCVH_15660 [Ignavibacteriaceae bacterium]
MYNGILNIEKQILITFLLFGGIAICFLPYMWIGIIILFASIDFFIWEDKYVIPFFIIAYLVITSDISENLRIVVNFGGFIILGYKFIKEFGFDFINYKSIPTVVQHFVVFGIL